MKSIISVSNLSFEFPNGKKIFNQLSLSLGEKTYGLVGPNGVGKSCLAKLLAGELIPTLGSIHKNSAVAVFKQRELPQKISVSEYLGYESEWTFSREALLERIELEELCTNLSGGQWMRVRLAHSLQENFLILDEPTNDLDRDGRQAVLRFIREHRGGLLIISHDREVLSMCDEILELSNRGLSKFGGDWEFYENEKNKEREGLNRNLNLAKKNREQVQRDRTEQIQRQEKRNQQGTKDAAKGGIPKILLGKRKRNAQETSGKVDAGTLKKSELAVQSAYEALQEVKIDPVMYANLLGEAIPAQKLVAEARDFNICFNEWLYKKDLEFSWRGNIRLALKGGNGSGKSTLLKALIGENYRTRGELAKGDLRILYIDQRCSGLDDNKSIYENIRDTSKGSESEIRSGLAKFLFVNDGVFQNVGQLSGGERLRAALAQGLLNQDRPQLLILDEPTNNLDLANIEFLENLVSQFQGALIVISHDEVFLENCGIEEYWEL